MKTTKTIFQPTKKEIKNLIKKCPWGIFCVRYFTDQKTYRYDLGQLESFIEGEYGKSKENTAQYIWVELF